MLVVAAAAMYFGVMSSKHAAFAAQGLGANLRKAQFDKISTFSFGNIDRFSTASLVTRLTNDVTNVQNMVAMALRLLIRSGVMIVASMAVAIYIRWQLAMILIIAVPVIALVIGLLMKVCMGPVSYTHLDVYKRQIPSLANDCKGRRRIAPAPRCHNSIFRVSRCRWI